MGPFNHVDDVADRLFDDLINVITHAIDNHPRSLQTAIGPSELGMPCTRRLAHKLNGTTPVRPQQAPWKPTVGTAIHAWLEKTFANDNATRMANWTRNNGDPSGSRWVLEQRLTVGDIDRFQVVINVDGSCDIYDTWTHTAIDWKSCGPSRLKHYHAHGPGQQYRTQGHLYGRGWAARGFPVERVMVVFLPRNGELREAFMWSEPYDEQIAINALDRASNVTAIIAALGPAAFAALPTDPTDCAFCPYWQPRATDLSQACPGDPDRAVRRDRLYDLVPS